MSGEKDKGLGFDWLDREAAEQTLYGADRIPPSREAETSGNVGQTAGAEASKIASEPASETASRLASEAGDDAEVAPSSDELPSPPPARQREQRVQFNHRILSDRDRILQKYKTKHATTMQAIVDQMVDEYLDRRGLLPRGDAK